MAYIIPFMKRGPGRCFAGASLSHTSTSFNQAFTTTLRQPTRQEGIQQPSTCRPINTRVSRPPPLLAGARCARAGPSPLPPPAPPRPLEHAAALGQREGRGGEGRGGVAWDAVAEPRQAGQSLVGWWPVVVPGGAEGCGADLVSVKAGV